MGQRVERLRREGLTFPAVVVEYEYDSEGDPYPVVELTGPDGRLITARTDFGGSIVPAVGAQVKVLYDPRRPNERAHIETSASNRTLRAIPVLGWAAIVLGAVLLIAVVVIVLGG